MACCQWCRRTCVCFLDDEEKQSIAIDKEIQRILRKQMKRERKEIKVLLLGTGESGKTTFIRQMRIIHGRGFSEEERRDFAKLIYQNIFTAVKAMTRAMITLKLPYAYPENEMYARWVQDVDVSVTQLDRGNVDAIRRLWADPGLRVCYSRRSEYQLLDSTEYYMTNLDRISAPDYIPTAQDVLRVRFPTTGIHDYSFTVQKITLRIVDVGGQKSERRKWIHCFQDVTSLIFLASLSEYDQVLEERETDNRMEESLALFYTTIHSPWFLNTSIILFLNKTDILADKIQASDLQKYFPGFTGKRRDAQDAMKYIQKMYKQQTRSQDKEISKMLYPHFTCATDTNNISNVFNAVKDTVLLKALSDYGVM
ncbi:guanine nucleotide-binding protein subunit alpha-11 isoform X1 [Salmo salar]|uniref:Guanine nucleotide-binding protein subunit alpha n=2 Tax=Salmo salar TaxID=8030 RepID=A0A1S3PC60_SALSA|nr:guanine nucleotide-binding protein subunit alpha-11-like isoform X1 [Salmo salar]XP_014025162.1 guanine nucleotide-binding protein subunit alpha-11-like isoform X1 [Salmo salar]|eukprot:XP_014025161.1 PREDICTED: guanine nucleotide-binding protein subunit alpha-11-like [Salmo salar]